MGEVVIPIACDPTTDEALDTLIRLAQNSAVSEESSARYLINKLDQLIEANTWPKRLEGQPKTWARFCKEVIGYDLDYITTIESGIKLLDSKGVENPTIQEAHAAGSRQEQAVKVARENQEPLREKAGRPSKPEMVLNSKNSTISKPSGKPKKGSTSAKTRVKQLRRDHPEIAERLEKGEFKSVAAACRAAKGKEPDPPRKTPSPLDLLRKAWSRATPEERRAFLAEVAPQ